MLQIFFHIGFVFSVEGSVPCRAHRDTIFIATGKASCALFRKNSEGKKELFLFALEKNFKDGKNPVYSFPGGKIVTEKVEKEIANKAIKRGTEAPEPKLDEVHIAEKKLEMEYVEPAVCSALREVHEETGVPAIAKALITNLYNENEKSMHYLFECEFIKDFQSLKPIDTHEVGSKSEFKWFNRDEALSSNYVFKGQTSELLKKLQWK